MVVRLFQPAGLCLGEANCGGGLKGHAGFSSSGGFVQLQIARFPFGVQEDFFLWLRGPPYGGNQDQSSWEGCLKTQPRVKVRT